MQIIRGLHNCQKKHHGGVLTIGNFDGLHLGHQKIFEQLNAEAKRLNTHSCLMTFEPLPREYFSGKNNSKSSISESSGSINSGSRSSGPARLMNREEKIRTLCNFPPATRPDYLLFLNFNQHLASMSAAEFIEDILLDTLHIKSVIIGDDFRFGCDRRGDFELLQTYGKKHPFSVSSIESHLVDQQRVSSSLIREALSNNQLDDANKMLGRSYKICGRINHGEKRGRTIGFPTANIHLRRPETPLNGVYSVTMHRLKNSASSNEASPRESVAGIANVGHRPTVNGKHVQLEVHLFDFDESIYGEQVCISFQHKIRDEKKFDSFDELKQQIKIDCEKAKNLLLNK